MRGRLPHRRFQVRPAVRGGDDLLIGGAGGDELMGHGDDDTLEGGPGNDGLRGGAGRDVVTYATSATGVAVNLNTGTASTNPGRDYEIQAIEDVIGSSFADVLIGDGAGNEINGGGGNDLINGRGGADDLDGQLGPQDSVSFTGAPAKIRASLQAGTASGWGSDSISDFEDFGGWRSGSTDRRCERQRAQRGWRKRHAARLGRSRPHRCRCGKRSSLSRARN